MHPSDSDGCRFLLIFEGHTNSVLGAEIMVGPTTQQPSWSGAVANFVRSPGLVRLARIVPAPHDRGRQGWGGPDHEAAMSRALKRRPTGAAMPSRRSLCDTWRLPRLDLLRNNDRNLEY